jgi:hypothetical protein
MPSAAEASHCRLHVYSSSASSSSSSTIDCIGAIQCDTWRRTIRAQRDDAIDRRASVDRAWIRSDMRRDDETRRGEAITDGWRQQIGEVAQRHLARTHVLHHAGRDRAARIDRVFALRRRAFARIGFLPLLVRTKRLYKIVCCRDRSRANEIKQNMYICVRCQSMFCCSYLPCETF